MEYNDHPINVVYPRLRENYGKELQMDFVEYDTAVRSPRSVEQSDGSPRRFIPAKLGSVNVQWMEERINDLSPSWEFGIVSRVVIDDEVFHLPVVDCSGKEISRRGASALYDMIRHWDMDYLVFSSGRSYHLYGTRLIPREEWTRFMGSLLLCGPISRKQRWVHGHRNLVDRRWVGHQLIRKCSILRWSANSPKHAVLPKLMGNLTDFCG